MNTSSKLKMMAIATLIAAGCSQVDARRPHIHHPARVVVIPTPVHRHVVTKHISNRFSQKERLAMALAYLNNNQRLTVKQYAKITSLNKDAAEAELDAFVLDRNIPILSIVEGKKKSLSRTRVCKYRSQSQ